MRRLGTMLMAGLLMLGLAQCKKEQTEEPDVDEDVYITVDVNGGSKGSRVIVNPNAPGGYATVAFENGDKLYVGNNGAYSGSLTYDGSKFSGRISNLSNNDYLHFYFVGGRKLNNTNITVDITDQTSRYPVIAYGHSTNKYSTTTASYSATLDIYCAIMKIPIEGAGTANTVTLHGMKNLVTVDMSVNNGTTTGNPFSFSLPETGYGEIKLHAESDTEKWAIVLPQGAVLAQLSCDGFKNTTVTVPAITADRYYDDDVSGVTLTPGTSSDFRFSVAANTQVCFAPGNLQAVFTEANTSSCTWRFADRQYDYVGDAVANTAVGENCVKIAGNVDLFGWVGASAQYAQAYGICYFYMNSAYGDYANESLKRDWGIAANAASLGGYNTWRTLSIDEWGYLFNTRSTSTTINGIDNARYTEATINTDGTPVNGIILFPDDGYSGPTSNAEANPMGITFGTINNKSCWGTQCTISGWISLEFAGCVFLPAAGYRHNSASSGTSYSPYNLSTWGGNCSVIDDNFYGFYWSSTPHEADNCYAHCLAFFSSYAGIDGTPARKVRGAGCSVRLVRPAN